MSAVRELISVIVPLYNKRSTIERALRSVSDQVDVTTEVIVVDDGSTDGSGEFVESLDRANINLIRQPNAGPGAARNRGAAAASGSLLAFLDADDEWCTTFLKYGTRALSSHPECVAYVSGYNALKYSNARPNIIARLGKKEGVDTLSDIYSDYDLMEHVHAMHSSCVLVRREAFSRAGGFYDEDRCVFGEDSYLWVQILLSGPVYWDPEPRVLFHVEDSELGFAVRYRTTPIPISIHAKRLESNCPADALPLQRRVVSAFVAHDLRRLARSGSFREARRLRALHNRGKAGDSAKDIAVYVLSNARRKISAWLAKSRSTP